MTTATTRNWAGLFFDKGGAVNNVKHPDFGAIGDGVANDKGAIQAAINAGGIVFFPPGVYRVASTLTISANNVVLVGCGNASQLRFNPSSGGTLLLFEGTTPGNGIKNAGIRDLLLRSDVADGNFNKIAVDCHDIRDFRMENVEIAPWSGGAGGSTGLKTRGRQNSSFEKLTIQADKPIHIAINDDGLGGTLDTKDADHFSFRDMSLLSLTAPNPVVIVEPGAILRNVNFGGFLVFKNGGLNWVDGATVPRGAMPDDKKSNNVTVENFRAEGIGSSPTTYAVQIQKNAAGPLYDLTLRNTLLAPLGAGWSGLRADNVLRVLAEHVRYEGGQTGYNISGGEMVNALASGPLVGLQVSWKTANQVEIARGRCPSDDNTYDIDVSSPITVDMTVSGAGGLDTGSEASSTWYAVWAIGKNRESTTSGLLSLSGTTPTMPAGYQLKRLVGWVRNDGSGNFRKFSQRGGGLTRRCYFDDRSNLAVSDGSATTFTNKNLSEWVPPGCDLAILMTALRTLSVATDRLLLRPGGSTSADTPWQLGPGVITGTGNKAVFSPIEMPTDSGRVIQWMVSRSDNRADIWVVGFEHEL